MKATDKQYSRVGSERIELSIFAMSRQRHKPLDHEPLGNLATELVY